MNPLALLSRLPFEQQEPIRLAIGAPTDLLRPRIIEPLAGIIVGMLLVSAGAIQFISYLPRAPAELWCLLGAGMSIAGGAVVLLSWRHAMRLPRLLIGPDGFALTSRAGAVTCRWDQIAQVITDELQFKEPALPFLKPPLGSITYTRVERAYLILRHDGETYSLSPRAFKNLGRLREHLEREAEARGIAWRHQRKVLA